MNVRSLLKAIRTSMLKARGQSDYSTWGSLDHIKENWEARTEAMSALVPPETRILEFGAGHRMLEKHLPPG